MSSKRPNTLNLSIKNPMEEDKESEHEKTLSPDLETVVTPKWLKRLQENSWEPEILISGLSLAFIFAFPAALYNFAAYAIQEAGLHFLAGFLVLVYLSGVVNIFKIFFIVHLTMRFAWVGAIGASYAFPKGVNNEALFNYSKGYKYTNINEHILKLEQLCSMAFGFPLMLALIFIPITMFLIILIGIYKLFDLPFFSIYILFMVLLLALTVISLMTKKSNFKEKSAKSLSGTLSALYASNLGKWKMNGYIIGIMILSVPFIMQDTKGFLNFFSDTSSTMGEEEWTSLENRVSQESLLLSDERFARIKLIEFKNGDPSYSIYLAYYKEDVKHIEPLKTHFSDTLQSLNWPQLEQQTDLYRVVVNDSIIAINHWLPITMPNTHQKAYEAKIDLSWLPVNEVHNLRVEKVLVKRFLYEKGQFRYRENWESLNFFN